MTMSNAEIVADYRHAKDKQKQITILSELNVCSKEEIIAILRAGGIDGRTLPREKKADPKPQTPRDREAPAQTGKGEKRMNRAGILDAAKECVCGQREQDYGSPENNFQVIANLWIDYLQGTGQFVEICPKDVAMMMALLKIARVAGGRAMEDSFVDLAGYAACGGEIAAGLAQISREKAAE